MCRFSTLFGEPTMLRNKNMTEFWYVRDIHTRASFIFSYIPLNMHFAVYMLRLRPKMLQSYMLEYICSHTTLEHANIKSFCTGFRLNIKRTMCFFHTNMGKTIGFSNGHDEISLLGLFAIFYFFRVHGFWRLLKATLCSGGIKGASVDLASRLLGRRCAPILIGYD